MSAKRVAIVGAGMGGLACAIDLAAAGFDVKVFERAKSGGGKARVIELGGVAIDAGPTVLTMPWVFDELFEAAGGSFRTEVSLVKADILARHAWSDGMRLDLHSDRERSADAIGQQFGPAEARSYLAFCEDGRRMLAISEKPFLRSQRPTMGTIIKEFGAAGALKAFAQLDGHRSMWRALEQRFASPRLRQLFGRYATYTGSSPYEAPATLNLVAFVETEGVYRVDGGMHALVRALERRAVQLGVELAYEQDVSKIAVTRGRASGVVIGERTVEADFVVWNGDVSGLAEAGKEAARVSDKTPFGDRSLSALTWTMKAKTRGFPLVRHNVFFSDDYAAEFKDIFSHRRAPLDPTVYVCAQDRHDEASGELDTERLLVLANAPATGDEPEKWTQGESTRCTTAISKVLERVGLTLEPVASTTTTPADFHRLFPGTGGALYGPRAKNAFSALNRRPAATKLPGLFLAGGSVHPGAGVPMAALSGRLAAARIREARNTIG